MTQPTSASPAAEMAQQPEPRGVAVRQRRDGAWVSACGDCGWEGIAMLSRAAVLREADAHRCSRRPPPAPEPERAAGEVLRAVDAAVRTLVEHAERVWTGDYLMSAAAYQKLLDAHLLVAAALTAEVPHAL